MKFEFDKEKNELLIRQRGISFQQIIEAIAENGVLLNIEHPHNDRYPNQWMFIVKYNEYTYCVPYVKNRNIMFLKTIFPNRNFMYLIKEHPHEKD